MRRARRAVRPARVAVVVLTHVVREPVLELRHHEVRHEVQEQRDGEQQERLGHRPRRVVRELPQGEPRDDLRDESDEDQATVDPVQLQPTSRLDHLPDAANEQRHAEAGDDRVQREEEFEDTLEALPC